MVNCTRDETFNAWTFELEPRPRTGRVVTDLVISHNFILKKLQFFVNILIKSIAIAHRHLQLNWIIKHCVTGIETSRINTNI